MMVILALEGVLAEPGYPIPIAGPNVWGRRLYEGFEDASYVILTESRHAKQTREWLLSSHFNRWIKLETMEGEPLGTSPLVWKRQVLERLLGYHPGFYVDADADAVRQATAIGIPGLLLAVPGQFPEHQHAYQPWDELTASIEHNILARAESRRQFDGS